MDAGSAWMLLCKPYKPLVWLWLSPWGDTGIVRLLFQMYFSIIWKATLLLVVVKLHWSQYVPVLPCFVREVLSVILWKHTSWRGHGTWAGSLKSLQSTRKCSDWNRESRVPWGILILWKTAESLEPESIRDTARGIVREDNEGVWNSTKQSQSLFKVAKKVLIRCSEVCTF